MKIKIIQFLIIIILLTECIYGGIITVGESGYDFTTIKDAINAAHAGDTVLVHQKTTPYNELVRFVRSGNEVDGYITLMAFPGENPVIDASGVSTGSDWIIGIVKIINKSYIRIEGFELRNLITSNTDKFPGGIWVRGNSNHIEIKNNNIHHIEHNNADGGAHGIAVYGTSSSVSINNILIDGNEVHHCKLAWSESVVLNGNVENFVVSNNVVHDNNNIAFDFIGFEGTCSDPELDQARNGLVTGNIAYNIDSRTNPSYDGDGSADGIYVDGGKDIIIERNIVYNCNIGVELASEHSDGSTSGIILRNNLIRNNHAIGIAIGGYDSQRGQTFDCVIVNNTLYHNRSEFDWGGEFYIQYYCTNNVFKNNIIYSKSNIPIIDYSNSTGSDFDISNNIYYSDGTKKWIWQGNQYNDFEAYRNATGNDSNSVFADPLLKDVQNDDPSLLENSPAINKGINLGQELTGQEDFFGNPRIVDSIIDIGAVEYDKVTGIKTGNLIIPDAIKLENPFPNPFNPSVTINFIIPPQEFNKKIELKIYDMEGELIADLFEGIANKSRYRVVWNAALTNGTNVSSGVYLLGLKVGQFSLTKKLIYLK